MSSYDVPYAGSSLYGQTTGFKMPYSAAGLGFNSQYGYAAAGAAGAAAASELSPVHHASSSSHPSSKPLVTLLNPVKSFRSLMSYLAGGIAG